MKPDGNSSRGFILSVRSVQSSVFKTKEHNKLLDFNNVNLRAKKNHRIRIKTKFDLAQAIPSVLAVKPDAAAAVLNLYIGNRANGTSNAMSSSRSRFANFSTTLFNTVYPILSQSVHKCV